MKIFLGTYNIASQLNDWRYGFQNNSCKVSTGSFGNHTHLVSREFNYLISDKYYNRTIFNNRFIYEKYQKYLFKIYGSYRRKLLNKLVKDYEVFIFIWESILDDYEDFEIIKNAGSCPFN